MSMNILLNSINVAINSPECDSKFTRDFRNWTAKRVSRGGGHFWSLDFLSQVLEMKFWSGLNRGLGI